MKLYLNRDIACDADKMRYWMSGDDAVSYNDISQFLDAMPEDDFRIDIEIHSCGGDCVEGYAIYDALRASGKEIHAVVVGQCASMASVILLAAPKENRTMFPHAQMLIHEPFFPDGLRGAMTIGKLESIQESLRAERARMLAVYAERTGCAEEILSAQIANGDWFGAERAIELGFVSSIVPTASAAVMDENEFSTTTNIEENQSQMRINEESALAKAFVAMGKAMGVICEDTPKAMVVTDVTGVEVNIEREEGEPQVGDAATPDGEFILEDGRTIVVVDGVITEIRPAEETEQTEETEETTDENTNEVDALKAEIEELTKKLEEAKANEKSVADAEVLDAVAKAGGIDKLKATAVGKFVTPTRAQDTKKTSASATEMALDAKLAIARERRNRK